MTKKKQAPSAREQTKAYLAAQPPVARKALTDIRRVTRDEAPGAEEAFSYAIPAFKLAGKPLIWYAGFTHHVSVYPIGSAIRTALARQLAGYETSKGTVRFPLAKPVPVALVKRLIKARIAEMRVARQKDAR